MRIKKISLFLCLLLLLIVSVRGKLGNPKTSDLNQPTWRDNGPFELSPERGRFALLYSLIEDRSFYFSTSLARFVVPDLGYAQGHYVSLFAPAVSFIVAPGYLLGRVFGLAQVGTFFIISLFSLANLYLVKKLSQNLGASETASFLAGFIFLFATPAYAYAVNLYQHHISTFLLLSSLYFALKPQNFKTFFLISFFSALSVSVDYPNAVMFAPVFLYSISQLFQASQSAKKIMLKINSLALIGIIGIVLPAGFFLWSNYQSYGNPFQLAGTIRSANYLDENGNPITKEAYLKLHGNSAQIEEIRQKTTTGFFRTRNLINGLYIHLFSPDRGVVYYTPVILIGIFGIYLAITSMIPGTTVLLATLLFNLTLYSMWGDPWGGWAFGSRYLIPGYAVLAVFLSLALSSYRRKLLFMFVFIPLAVYSISVNTLGAVTTSTTPPRVEISELEKLSGRHERFSWDRNWEFLTAGHAKSFIYQTFLEPTVKPINYYYSLLGFVLIIYLFTMARLIWQK